MKLYHLYLSFNKNMVNKLDIDHMVLMVKNMMHLFVMFNMSSMKSIFQKVTIINSMKCLKKIHSSEKNLVCLIIINHINFLCKNFKDLYHNQLFLDNLIIFHLL